MKKLIYLAVLGGFLFFGKNVVNANEVKQQGKEEMQLTVSGFYDVTSYRIYSNYDGNRPGNKQGPGNGQGIGRVNGKDQGQGNGLRDGNGNGAKPLDGSGGGLNKGNGKQLRDGSAGNCIPKLK